MALSGWIKLHRAISDHHIASDPCSLAVWIHLLLNANHADTKRQINGRVLTVGAGQLITSRKSISAKTGVQESKVERILSMLKNEHQIEQHGSSKFRVISIVNWSLYQSPEQQNEQQVNSRRTTDEQQMNTPEEVSSDTKNVKNAKNKSNGVSSEIFESAWRMYPQREGSNPKNKAASAWNARVTEGEEEQTMIDGLARYLDYCKSKGSIGTVYVMQGSRFFGPSKEYLGEWKASSGEQKNSRHHGFDQRDYNEGLFQREDGTYGLG